ncbi:hypothetical protein BC830DRAFT_1098283 [Chytriomyces sp. MP71]|nr:hypothetical protein BC830DRAFT_1151612 [Chytriomyces sp. MP71]KAI8620615.1 hypothetical protein BC830DRAFT_1098283 [Chytriomyces sp. MP71]
MLELGHGRGGLLEGYTTKVNYCDLCLTIAECYSYSVGTKSDGRKAVEWLEKCWNHKASSTTFLQLLSGVPKNTDQKMAAKILAIWWQTGKPPVVPFHLDRNVFSLVAANASSAFVKSDANKAKLWEGRAAF